MTGNPCAEIDLSGIDQSPPAAPARAAGSMEGPILEALDAIDGLSLRHVSYRHDDHGRLSGVVTFSGWSPSLHAIPVEIPVFADTGGQDEVLFRIGHRLDRQRDRAAHARSLGILGPLRGTGYGIVHHLWTDRTLVAMREGDPTLMPTVSHLATAIDQIHRSGENHDGGPYVATTTGVVAETAWGNAGGVTRVVGAAVDIMPDGFLQDRRRPHGPLPSFDGLMVSIPSDPLPETALVALSGRPVGDLAVMHPLLDARTIDHARNTSDGKRVVAMLTPDLVKVRDIV